MIDTRIVAKFDKPFSINDKEYNELSGKIRDIVLVSNSLVQCNETQYLVKFDKVSKEIKLEQPIIKLIKPEQITQISEEW